MNKAIALSVLAAATFAGVASAQVTNGSFETGDFTGWNQFGNTGFTGVGDVNTFGVAPVDGTYLAFFGAVGSSGGISQTITANIGDQITISFYTYNLGGTPSSFSADFDGNNLMNYANTNADSGWVFNTFNVTVGSVNPTLSFNIQQDPSYILVDNITVTPAPGAAAALGLAGIGAARRRRR